MPSDKAVSQSSEAYVIKTEIYRSGLNIRLTAAIRVQNIDGRTCENCHAYQCARPMQVVMAVNNDTYYAVGFKPARLKHLCHAERGTQKTELVFKSSSR